ncbi:hypothetical protein LEP1GSC038_1640 [Leptospira weilii str. 2006001855]|uniref:Uncharacterized protein n=1 Tax=Leptospira weilii str. 2006001855 TaxID=996804 RepID=M6FIW8_9LEPT|nr:hypothetical protein LEP1GSC038_1640 [Leptospira weilii str. 2006001855]
MKTEMICFNQLEDIYVENKFSVFLHLQPSFFVHWVWCQKCFFEKRILRKNIIPV